MSLLQVGLSVRALGTPAAQGNHRVSASGRIYEQNARALKDWRSEVAWSWRRTNSKLTFTEPVAVTIAFFLQRPGKTRFPELPAGRPDLDKLTRAVLDGLTAAGAWGDDSQVTSLHATKRWADGAEPPGCSIVLFADMEPEAS